MDAASQRMEKIMSFITPGHVRAFQAIRSQLYDNVTLASCKINGEPGVAIVMIEHAGENKIGVMPLFVALTDSMEIEFIGFGSSGGEEGGGPKDPREDFEAAKAEIGPQPS
jgi:hypothetical protein